jgi:catechol 2,3-dioxygenase-like lactoylglutathione lyase family enzyme
MQPRINMITLGVNDLQKSIDFYENGLGFPRMDSPGNVAFFTLNGSWLGLYNKQALAEDATVPAEGSGFSGFALAHLLGSEKEVDETFKKIVEAGAIAVKEPQKVFWGGYSSYIKDPDGYLWELAYNPFFWIGPKDDS